MTLEPGTHVDHLDFGPGLVVQSLGDKVIVNFYGEEIDCELCELSVRNPSGPRVLDTTGSMSGDKVAFRRAFEAANLGVVPPDTSALVEMSIGGQAMEQEILSCLKNAPSQGLCKVVFGNYGTGKSHYLHLASVIARRAGWLVSYVEFDPKAVDPAKPHLVYREIMAKLRFPEKEDGTQQEGFLDLIKEIREHWGRLRTLPLLKKSPWFRNGLETLRFYPHDDSPDYVSACGWLMGQNVGITGPGSIRGLARGTTNINPSLIPSMPKVRETAEIYVFHLAVINEIAKALKYKGFLIILDEAEHIRGFNVRRRERANNFYDFLALTAHPPLVMDEGLPSRNEHGYDLPRYWAKGPHFGLYIGLTEGDTFQEMYASLRDACVFLHDERDKILLAPPTSEEYGAWCNTLLESFLAHYPAKAALITDPEARHKISNVLQEEFEMYKDNAVMRSWVKLACLVPSVLFSGSVNSVDETISVVKGAVKELMGGHLPWE